MGNETKQRVGEDLVTLAQASRQLAETRLAHQDWSGVPLPVPGLELVLEPRYKLKTMSEFRWKEFYDENGVRTSLDEESAPAPSEYRRVNSWWSDRLRARIVVLQGREGRARAGVEIENGLWFALRTLEAAAAWPVEAELKAQKKLASLIPEHLFDTYTLTGYFSEVSNRSQVTYIFRRGRPTITMREDGDGYRVLCALCLHPIGYYDQTWAGVMCPTDEVIAHLLMMRGSEEKFWANANQHPIDRPAAGV